MIDFNKAFSGFSVNDIAAAKTFYSEVLGATVTDEMYGNLALHVGDTFVLIYAKPNHEPASFTILNFKVADVEKTVADLKMRGVRFEHYDMGNASTDADGIFRAGGPLIAWFKDPAGNVLSVIQE